MKLITVHVYNRQRKKPGTAHPSCVPCFQERASEWENDPIGYFRLHRAPEGTPIHPQYEADKCFYCQAGRLSERTVKVVMTEAERKDMLACHEAIKKARAIRWKPVERLEDRATWTNISREMWDILKPVIEVDESIPEV